MLNIGWINGTFDVIHAGHIELFRLAKENCDYLVVGTDTDSRISYLKGPSRPINKLDNRVKVLESIKFIDKVVTFSTDEYLRELIKNHKCNIMFIGEEYKNKPIVGSDLFEEIVYIPKYDGLSSTQILNKGKNE